MNLCLISVNADFNMDFVEVKLSSNVVSTGETFTLSGKLINNSTETIASGQITFIITNETIYSEWRPPRVVSSTPGVVFQQEISPGEYLNFSYVLKPLDPGKFSILVEVSTMMGALRSSPLEVEVYGQSIDDDTSPVRPVYWPIGGVSTLLIGSALVLTFWFRPSFRASIVARVKGLKEKSLETISTLLAISLVQAAPHIALPFLTITESGFSIIIFLRTYSSAFFFGLPVFAILHGISTKMPIRSFLTSLVPMVAYTLIVNLTRLNPFSPISEVIFDLSLALYLGLIGAGAALTKARRTVGYTLLALGIILWAVSLIDGILRVFSPTPFGYS